MARFLEFQTDLRQEKEMLSTGKRCRNSKTKQLDKEKVALLFDSKPKGSKALKEVLTDLNAELNEASRLSLSSFYRYVKANKIATYRKPKLRGYNFESASSLASRRKFIEAYVGLLANHKNIYYVDEASFNCDTFRGKLWLPKDKEVKIAVKTNAKKVNVVAAINRDKGVFLRCYDNNGTQEQFRGFIEELTKEFIEVDLNYGDAHENAFLVLDNSSIHKAKDLLNFSRNCELMLAFQSPYCPEFNAVELLFAYIRAKFSRKALTSSSLKQQRRR